MANNTIDTQLLSRMFLAGAKELLAHKDYVNELNVFPVPDGDTGTNMTMTIMTAAREVAGLDDDCSMEVLAKAISSGSLRGARGNSGVILSQLCRGFCKVIKKETEIDGEILARANEKAVESAYKAVMKPKEGTILTVAKAVCEKSVEVTEQAESDLSVILDEIIAYAEDVLNKTPDMLPVLKEAGVVDSGGQGLLYFLIGARKAFNGEELDLTIPGEGESLDGDEEEAADDGRFAYELKFKSHIEKLFNIKHEMDLREYLESIGDAVDIMVDGEIASYHLKTNDPGLALQRAMTYGPLYDFDIKNLKIKAEDLASGALVSESSAAADIAEPVKKEHKKFGFVSVSVGDGINAIFRELGVDEIIEGGQTMNPSTDDIIKAIEKVDSDTVFVLPNNKNIIMAADQAKAMTEDKEVIVIPTRTIPQGITAVVSFNESADASENEETLKEEIGNVSSGQVTYSIRNTEIDGKTIHEGDYMGIGDKGLLSVGTDLKDTTLSMIETMVSEADAGLISIYYGADVKDEDVQVLEAAVREQYTDCDVEVQFGGQPVYYYVVSVE